jgi:ADP-heptose:LPS heptosyltransferase
MHLLESAPPRRIAILRALQLGDVLCAVPAFRALRAACPDAEITLIGLPWSRTLVGRLPYLDDFIEFPGFPGLGERTPALEAIPDFLRTVQSRGFDLALQMHGSGGVTNPLVAAFGARRTAGFFAPGAWCPDPATYLPWPERCWPEIRRWLALMAYLGAPVRGEHLEYPIHAEERAGAVCLRAQHGLEEGRYVLIHPGARFASRRWHAQRFAAVADALAARGLAIAITGSASEAPLAAAVRAHMRGPAADLTGATELGALAAVVASARLVVCNDTGMSHVAAAVRTPSVVVCCGADPERWRPLDHARHRVLWHHVPCRPCPHEQCPTAHECADGVAVEAVLAECARLLDREAPRVPA